MSGRARGAMCGVLGVVLAAAIGCAATPDPGVDEPSGVPRTSSAAAPTSAGCPVTEAFDISLPSDSARSRPYGAPTPDQAVRSTQWGLPAEYLSAQAAWTTVANGADSVRLQSDDGAKVVVVRVADGSWTVLSGERCR